MLTRAEGAEVFERGLRPRPPSIGVPVREKRAVGDHKDLEVVPVAKEPWRAAVEDKVRDFAIRSGARRQRGT